MQVRGELSGTGVKFTSRPCLPITDNVTYRAGTSMSSILRTQRDSTDRNVLTKHVVHWLLDFETLSP